MKKEFRKVIDRDSLPSSYPIQFTLLIILSLDHWNAPGWLWGVTITLLIFLWIYALARMDDELKMNPFKKSTHEEG